MEIDPDELEFALEHLSTLVRGMKPVDEAGRLMSRFMDDALVAAAMEAYETMNRKFITLKDPAVLSGNKYIESWYAGPDFDGAWCWPAYKQMLKNKGWTNEVIKSLDDASTKIMAHLPHPGESRFNTRGLVVGYVQSGKTANFTGLISKAADAGYKLFIVLAGMTSSLRRQTQRRLEAELKDANQANQGNWLFLTDRLEDFRGMARGNPNALLNPSNHKMRIMCVVKKNTHILRRLRDFLQNTNDAVLGSCPVLIIDDEADQASVNTKKKAKERSAINQRIVRLLEVLPKSAYVGYTATPFANLFIDPSLPKDLYPRDFIFDLPMPGAYFGAERIFGRNALIGEEEPEEDLTGLDVIRTVPEADVPLIRCKRASERFDFFPQMAESLRDAVDYYLLAVADRFARDHSSHCSMLVHTTLFVDTHDKLRDMLQGYLEEFTSEFEDGEPQQLERLQELWENERSAVTAAEVGLGERPSFAAILDHLPTVLERCSVVVDNGSLGGLDYTMQEGDEHKVFIAVGGNTLSRGLTLEGLVVSYFVRPANAYDTLLQMGRWFGYRIGYEDLPRVWMTEDLAKDFKHLATVEAEIREDIRRYEKEGLSPLEYGVRVATHPKLAITSRLKMQNVTLTSASYSERHLQTFLFEKDNAELLLSNQEAARTLLSKIHSGPVDGSKWIEKGVPAELILDFLAAYQIPEEHRDLRFDLLKKYIKTEMKAGSLKTWNVGVFGNESSTVRLDLGVAEVGTIQRSRFGGTEPANIKVLTSARDRIADLDVSVSGHVSTKTRIDLRNDHDANSGFLMLYPIDKDSEPGERASKERQPLKAVEHLIGIGLTFPKSVVDQGNYVMNSFEFLVDGSGLENEFEEEADLPTIIPEDDESEQDG